MKKTYVKTYEEFSLKNTIATAAVALLPFMTSCHKNANMEVVPDKAPPIVNTTTNSKDTTNVLPNDNNAATLYNCFFTATSDSSLRWQMYCNGNIVALRDPIVTKNFTMLFQLHKGDTIRYTAIGEMGEPNKYPFKLKIKVRTADNTNTVLYIDEKASSNNEVIFVVR